MRIFTNKEVKRMFLAISALLIGCIVAGQIFVLVVSSDFKNKMIIHDSGIMGYLYQHNGHSTNLAAAFTSEKTKAHYKNGEALLQTAGYNHAVNNSLLPEIKDLQVKYAVLMLVLTVTLTLAILTLVYFYIARQNRIFEKASSDLLSFMKGDYGVRLKDDEEGSLSVLFSAVNLMATSLTAHMTKEKHSKEFLKDTIEDISHQLKTPLTALQMYTDIIKDENCDNEVINRFVVKSKGELERMEKLILILLKLARLDAGDIQLEMREHCAEDFLNNIVNGFLTRAGAEGKSLTVTCDKEMLIKCDEDWMHQAISNIIKNALDHTSAGECIEISCNETPCIKEIVIKDTGEGISKEEIHHIFKRFYKSTRSKDKQGIGIGLALAKAIIEKHGGLITVQSKLGEGTAFRITFPKLTNM